MTASTPPRSGSRCQSSSASPTRARPACASTLVARSGELDDPELHARRSQPRGSAFVVLDQRVRQQLAAHLVEPRRVLDVELDQPADVDVGHAPPNDKGWYDGNVTVRWTVTDDQPNIAAPPDTVVSAEGDDVTATSAQVCDKRGNCSTGSLQHLKIDKTPPAVTIEGPADGANYTLGAVPARRCTPTDPGGAGVPAGSCVVTVSGGTSAGVGVVTVSRHRHRPGRQRQAKDHQLHRRVRRGRPGSAGIRLEAEGVQAGLDGGRTAEDP